MLLNILTILSLVLLAQSHNNERAKPTTKPSSAPCYSRTVQQVRDLYSRWNIALQSKDSQIAAAEYWDDSILLPTISNVIRNNKDLKIEYFNEFLKKNPYGTVVEDFIDNKGCNYVQVRTISVSICAVIFFLTLFLNSIMASMTSC